MEPFLRNLLRLFDGKPWAAILISAIIFGLVHGNSAQFLNASLLGILLGWMFYRTGSIIPGFVLHWVNNTVVYVVANLMPGFEDASLSQLSNGRTDCYRPLHRLLSMYSYARFGAVKHENGGE